MKAIEKMNRHNLVFGFLLLSFVARAFPSPTSDLSSPSQEVRDAAGRILRNTYTPPSREKWDAIIASIKPGDPLSKVLDAIRPYKPAPAPQIFDGGGASQDSYWLDGLWILRCEYTEPGKTVIKVSLTEQLRSVYVKPPAGFTGVWTTYYLNGQPQSSIEFKNGRYFGTFTSFSPDGSKSVVQHYDGTGCNGEDTGYFRSGKIMYRAYYRANKESGIWTWYNEDGSVREMQGHEQMDSSLSNLPTPPKNQKVDRITKDFNDELENLKAIPTLPRASDFKTTRCSVLSKYIQLYLRVCDAANKRGKLVSTPVSISVTIPVVHLSGFDPTDIKDSR